jgi:hypothetical protein
MTDSADLSRAPIEKYVPPIGVRLKNWIALGLLFAGCAQTWLHPTWLFEDPAVVWLILSGFAVWLVLNALRFPSIAAVPDGLHLYYPWGGVNTIGWQYLISIKPGMPGSGILSRYAESYLTVTAHTLGPIYALLGRLYGDGGRAFFIFRYQPGYDGLITDFKEYAPHALAKVLWQ